MLEIRRQRNSDYDKAEHCDLGAAFAEAIEAMRQDGRSLESWQLVSTNVLGPRSIACLLVEVIVAVFTKVPEPESYMERRPMTGGLKMT